MVEVKKPLLAGRIWRFVEMHACARLVAYQSHIPAPSAQEAAEKLAASGEMAVDFVKISIVARHVISR
jgi:hypothetical protein